MTTPVYLTGFEHGTDPTTNGGGLADLNTGVGTTCVVVTTPVHSGTYALKVAPTGSSGARWAKTVATPTVLVYRIYLYISTSPSSAIYIINAVTTTSSSYPYIWLNPVGNYIELRVGNPGTTYGQVAYQTGRWYCIDYKADVSANPWQVNCVITDTTTGTATALSGTNAQAADTFARLTLGTSTAGVSDYVVYYDDLIISTTAGDYPIGQGKVTALVPTSDGTHNAGTNVMEDQSGNDIGAVTAYNLIDEIPLTSTSDYIRQAANGTGNYAEVNFADTAETNIHGVSAVLAYHSASTVANNGSTYIYDGANQRTVYSGDMSETSLFYKSAIITLASVSKTSVNALIGRVGYSSDADPDPYWDALILEVATGYDATVTGVVGTSAAAGVAPAITGTANVTGTTGTASASMPSPAVTATQNPTVTSVTATSAAAAIAPAVTATQSATVTGVASTAAAAGIAPSISGAATVSATLAESPAAAISPSLTGDANIAATLATATAEALAPAVSAGGSVTVSAVPAEASAAGIAPALSADGNTSGATATASADAISPAVSAGASATVSAVPATAASDTGIPVISAGGLIQALFASATAAANAPTVTVQQDASITAVTATATAAMPSPVVSAEGAVILAIALYMQTTKALSVVLDLHYDGEAALITGRASAVNLQTAKAAAVGLTTHKEYTQELVS